MRFSRGRLAAAGAAATVAVLAAVSPSYAADGPAAPSHVPVDGTIFVIPGEPPATSPGTAPPPGEGDRYLVATEDGALVPLDPGSLPTAFAAQLATPRLAAPTPTSHTVDVVYYENASDTRPTQAQISALVADTAAYWKTQSNGAVSALTINRYLRVTGPGATTECNQDTLWADAVSRLGTAGSSYTGGRHLLTIINRTCVGGPAGLASLGGLGEGGVIWVNLSMAGAGWNDAVGDSLWTLAHELGHNLGMNHASARYCNGNATDSADRPTRLDAIGGGWYLYEDRPAPPCQDAEYAGEWDVMGSSWGDKPPALSMSTKDALGVLPGGALTTVTPATVSSSPYTLAAASATSGVRGLKVLDPAGGYVYVEYRNGKGQDDDAGDWLQTQPQYSFSDGSGYWISASGEGADWYVTTGVQMLKSYSSRICDANGRNCEPNGFYGDIRSIALTYRSTTAPKGRYLAVRAGQSIAPYSNRVRVRVQGFSADRSQAYVVVDYSLADVPTESAFYGDITWLAQTGITTGYGDGTFRPANQVTREAMAAFLYRFNGSPSFTPPSTSPFSDVPTGHAFYKEITWLAQTGVTTGYADGTFRPGSQVTREAMAAFLYRYAGSPPYTLPAAPQFKDVPLEHPFASEIGWLASTGITTGYADSTFRPRNRVTREAMAAFLHRYDE